MHGEAPDTALRALDDRINRAESGPSDRARSIDMPTRVLILGLRPALVENFQRELGQEDMDLLTGTDLDGLRAAFLDNDVDHVILGGGLDIATRADAVQ